MINFDKSRMDNKVAINPGKLAQAFQSSLDVNELLILRFSVKKFRKLLEGILNENINKTLMFLNN